jgi:hypothetical protein
MLGQVRVQERRPAEQGGRALIKNIDRAGRLLSPAAPVGADDGVRDVGSSHALGCGVGV